MWESRDFAESGGMIEFLLEGNKIRFEINLGAVNAAKLKMSAPADAGENGYWDCGGKLGGVLS